jgi:hypothetical protein
MRERKERPLSEPMKAALEAMPFTLTMWGGKPMGHMPGPFTMKSIEALWVRGLARPKKVDAFMTRWEAVRPMSREGE